MRLASGALIVIDGGTGIRAAGIAYGACQATVLLSHYHWDHIQGFPFFLSAHHPKSEIIVYGPEFEGRGPEVYLRGQLEPPYFPEAKDLMTGVSAYCLTPCEPFEIGGARIRVARTSHPGVTMAYRIEEAGHTFVYMSDNEVDGATPEMLAALEDLARGADVLVHDCQYTESEYARRAGWGHSTPRQAARLAREAGVGELLVFHHDPAHSDDEVDEIVAETQSLAANCRVRGAFEGLTITLGGDAENI